MKRILGYLLTALIPLYLLVTPAYAVSIIDFSGGGGGTINYAGGTAPFVGTNLPIDFVSAPSSPILSIFGGALNFTTGSFLSSANFGPVFFDVFNGGGSFAITGAVPGAGIPTSTPLLTGSFAGPSTFTGSTFSGLPGAFSSILDVTFVDSTLTNFLNFPQSFGGGSVAQLEFNLTYASSADLVSDFQVSRTLYSYKFTPLNPPPFSSSDPAWRAWASWGGGRKSPGSNLPIYNKTSCPPCHAEPSSILRLRSGQALLETGFGFAQDELRQTSSVRHWRYKDFLVCRHALSCNDLFPCIYP